MTTIRVGKIDIANEKPMVMIGGMNVLEDRDTAFRVAEAFCEATSKLGIPYVFKGSYDKANRSSIHSFRGPGMEEGLKLLGDIRQHFGVPVLTDVHTEEQAAPVAAVCDIIQIPAFLARQTDLVDAMARTGAVINIKKPQFLSPPQMKNIVEKIRECGNEQILLCERGSCFGYDNLVVDMRSFPIMRGFGYPVVFDVTHSVQLPGGLGDATDGQAEYIEHLARAGVASGIDGLFMEVHDNPPHALSDATTQFALEKLESLLETLLKIHELVRPAIKTSC